MTQDLDFVPFACIRPTEQQLTNCFLLSPCRSTLPSTERPMKIEIVVDPTRIAPAASLAARVEPSPAATTPTETVPRLVTLFWNTPTTSIGNTDANMNVPFL